MIQIGDMVKVFFDGRVTEIRISSSGTIYYKVEESDCMGATLINGKDEHITKIDD